MTQMAQEQQHRGNHQQDSRDHSRYQIKQRETGDKRYAEPFEKKYHGFSQAPDRLQPITDGEIQPTLLRERASHPLQRLAPCRLFRVPEFPLMAARRRLI